MFEGDERQHHGMLIELDAVNHALCEHTDSARGGFYLRLLINLLDQVQLGQHYSKSLQEGYRCVICARQF